MKLAIASAIVAIASASPEAAFEEFRTRYQKQYATMVEMKERQAIFQQNLELIAKQNFANPNAHFAVNEFSDLTPEEFAAQRLGAKPPQDLQELKAEDIGHTLDFSAVPDAFDWRDAATSCLTPIKNQGQCGSCWAFSATETIESFWQLKNNDLFELSPQQIVSCSRPAGCKGGWPSAAMNWVAQNKGMMLEKDYPYTHHDATSGADCTYVPGVNKTYATDTGFSYTGRNNETEMMAAVSQLGPISICVDAAHWSAYRGGVLSTCTSRIDHAVQLVGYDSKANPPYWIVRNSWGAHWGEQGFIRLQMGIDEPKGICGIAEYPVAPKMA